MHARSVRLVDQDANILIRAVFGKGVRRILAEEHLAALVIECGGDAVIALHSLRSKAVLGTIASGDQLRDPDDGPILAAVLALGSPIWTEDTGFFGCGVAGGPPQASAAS